MSHTVLEPKPLPSPLSPLPRARAPAPAGASNPAQGQFANGEHRQAAVAHRFKLFTPPQAAPGRRLPLVVMLHGCTQDPDSFAAATAMNDAARVQGFYVLYPAQSHEISPSRCWNWFKQEHQQRGSGEPAMIASLTQAVTAQHGIDAHRVYIAGLSAGGAMAAIVAAAYPEIFAAVGVHSGLPVGAASDAPGALALMKTGSAGTVLPDGRHRPVPEVSVRPARRVPTIVFHGDQDATVHPHNGERVFAAARDGADAPHVERGVSAQGRSYTRAISGGSHRDPAGPAVAEHWVVHGTGHAWSGGQSAGRFTDAKGPDATREILRFFFQQPLAAASR